MNSTSGDLIPFADDPGNQSGSSTVAGDIDGDGTDDLITGAHQADPAGGTDAGETYVTYVEKPESD